MKAFAYVLSLICLAALCSAVSPVTAHAQTKELRYSLYLPPRSVEGGIVPQFLVQCLAGELLDQAIRPGDA